MKQNKHGAIKVTLDGIRFDSKAESRRYLVLKQMQIEGLITDLQLQPVFILAPRVLFHDAKRYKPALRYFADFAYIKGGARIVEDVKSPHTCKLPAFQIKRHLLKVLHDIDLWIVK